MKYLMTIILIFAYVPCAMAAGGEAKTGWDAWSTVVWHTINFIILLALLVKLGGPTVRSALQNRANQISREIDEASKIYEDAQAMLTDYKARFASLKLNPKKSEESRQLQEAERQRIVAEAEAEADRIKSEAERCRERQATSH